MKKLLAVLVLFLLTTGCYGLAGIPNEGGDPPNDYYDGTWSMCKIQHGDIWGNVPYKTNGLPIGGGDGDKFEIQCKPIPKR